MGYFTDFNEKKVPGKIMKTYTRHLINVIFFAAVIFFASCSNSPESVYERMLDKYAEGKGGNITLMAEKFLMAFSDNKVEYSNIFFNKSVILSIKGEDIEIVYPESLDIKGDKSIGANISFADMNEENVVLGNGNGFCVFDDDGDPHTVYKSEKKERIDAVALKGKNIIYLSEGKIFELNCADKKVTRMDSGEYHSPYKKYFRSSILVTDKFITLVTGIAGSYYISIFDIASGTSLMKNISSSSSELNMNDSNLSYVRGGTGSWSVERYELPSKKRTQVREVGKINNIFIAKDGFITLNGKKYTIENFSGEKGIMPQDWNIIGICRNAVLIEYGKIVYIIDFPVLMQKIKELNEKTGEKVS